MSGQDFNFNQLAKYLKPEASGDLNRFLESVPDHVGKAALIAAGIAWASTAGLGLYTMVHTQELSKLRQELAEKRAIQPSLPKITKKKISKIELDKFVKNMGSVYTGLEFRVNKNKITVIGKSLGAYPQFREATGHIVNIKRGWVANLDSLCVGRECKGDKLAAIISLNTISVE